jgi:serine/threonine protein kinase
MTDGSLNELGALDSLVAGVVDEFLERQQRGERPSVEELAGRHPEHAATLREVLRSLEVAGLSEGGGPHGGVPHGGGSGQALGDFRIVREVGRGGMGIVYEAEQLSLARRVALKILPFAAVLDPRHLQRFKNEAMAAAHLDHPHIVEVYGVGCDRGIHYYAMRFIDGVTLAEVVRDRLEDKGKSEQLDDVTAALSPSADSSLINQHSALAAETSPVLQAALSTVNNASPKDRFRRIAELGIQAAEGLDHAHQMGIVHRDIKPSNLMLDERGKLWITDFGLAHSAGDASMTMTGDLVGTLRYMSPEQAESGAAIFDHRTDIYSLGATLYELATDRPVVQAQERAAILREIAEKDAASPRKYSPGMPADLETILLKCLNKEPTARYDSAKALAEDLRRFLEQKPVVARRATFVDCAVRWGKRHRTLLTIGSVAGVAFVVVATLLTLALLAERNALHAVNRDLLLVVEYYEKRDEWERSDAPAEAARSLLGMLEKSSGNTSTKRALANTHLYIANAAPEASPTKSPNQDYVTAVRLLEELVEHNPADAGLKADLAVAHNALGNHLYTDCDEYARAFVHWRRAYNLWKACEGERFWLDTSYLAFSVKIAETYAYCPDRSVRGGPGVAVYCQRVAGTYSDFVGCHDAARSRLLRQWRLAARQRIALGHACIAVPGSPRIPVGTRRSEAWGNGRRTDARR